MSFNNENEKKAYAEIRFLLTKERKPNIYNLYFNSLLNYKMKKIKNNQSNFSILKDNNKLKILKEKYALRIRASLKVPITFKDFSLFINSKWTPDIQQIKAQMKERIDYLKQYNDFFCDTISHYRNDILNCLFVNNQLLNVMLMNYWCGNVTKIDNNNSLTKDRIVKLSQIDMKMKEFFMKYQDRLKNNALPRNESLFQEGKLDIKSSNYYSDDDYDSSYEDNCNNGSSYDNNTNMSLDLLISNSHIDECKSH